MGKILSSLVIQDDVAASTDSLFRRDHQLMSPS